jgi:predicted metal-dependent peptidase
MSREKIDEQRVAAARLWGALHFPYLATALFASPVVSAPGLGSIAVDRSWRLYVDPELVRRWSPEEIGSMLVHHAGHLLRDHAGRADQLGIDDAAEKAWVAAADAEINDDLVETDIKFPTDPIVPSALGCEAGRFAEEYFRLIRERKEYRTAEPGSGEDDDDTTGSAGTGGGRSGGAASGGAGQSRGGAAHAHHECGSGAHGKDRTWELRADGVAQISPASAHLLRCKVASEIRSSCSGKLPGDIPLGWRRWADEILDPRVDWRRALAAAVRTGFASKAGCVDYSYMRPSRRASVMSNVVMPAMRKPLPTVAVVVDTSRSMSDLLSDAVAEVDGILRGIGVGRDRLHVLSCDTEVHRVQRLTSVKQVELYGGGGTNMGAGIASALQLKPRPSVIVVLTDGYTPWPATQPNGAKVVVGLLGNGKWEVPAWAKLVRIEPAS